MTAAVWTPAWMPADDVGTECAGEAQPGTRALEQALTSAFPATSLGVYACRESTGGSGLSTHAEGRAVDVRPEGWSASTPAPYGQEMLQLLGTRAAELGIQRVIWFERQYDFHAPLGRVYRGASPHHDHLHVEQTWAAARSLTQDQADALVMMTLDPFKEDLVLCLRRFDDLDDGVRWLWKDGARYRLNSWDTGPAALERVGIATVALTDAQLRTIREV